MASDAQNRSGGRDTGSPARRLVSLDGLVPSGRRLGFDLAAIVTWVLLVAAALHGVGAPAWLYYALVAAGVVGYSLLATHAEALAERARRR